MNEEQDKLPEVDADFVWELSELMRLFRASRPDQESWSFDEFMFWVDELTDDIGEPEADLDAGSIIAE